MSHSAYSTPKQEEATQPLLEVNNLTKTFQSVIANDGVSLSVMPGEIQAILGENGAGKSTLMKMIYGVLTPDRGTIKWRGKEVRIKNPAQARAVGIGMVFQHFSLFESLTVAENIALATPHTVRELRPKITSISNRFALPVDPDTLIHSLAMGERQRVEIIRCLLQEPQLIVLDEPTSVLPPSGVKALFDTIRKLTKSGCAVLFISHKLDEIRSLCDRATVMRRGKVIATVNPAEETSASLGKLMIGREIPHPKRAPKKPSQKTAFELKQLTLESNDPFGTTLNDVNLLLKPGEIVGIAGVSGNGQKELSTVISGERVLSRQDSSKLLMFDQFSGDLDSGARRKLGMAYVPEDRNSCGTIPEMNLKKNSLLTAYIQGMVNRGFIDRSLARTYTNTCIDEMDVHCDGWNAQARSLSGGNLQKFIIGREISLNPEILIVVQPTWGVDIGAAAAIRQRLIDLSERGVAILVISDELDELIEITDRIYVMFRGQLSDSIDRAKMTDSLIGSYMAGEFLAAQPTEEGNLQ